MYPKSRFFIARSHRQLQRSRSSWDPSNHLSFDIPSTSLCVRSTFQCPSLISLTLSLGRRRHFTLSLQPRMLPLCRLSRFATFYGRRNARIDAHVVFIGVELPSLETRRHGHAILQNGIELDLMLIDDVSSDCHEEQSSCEVSCHTGHRSIKLRHTCRPS